MLYASDSSRPNQAILVLRLGDPPDLICPYIEALKRLGLSLRECFTSEDVSQAMQSGCLAGLLTVRDRSQLEQLDQVESFVGDDRICWVGLVAEELIATPRMRAFVGEYLFNFITMPADIEHVVLTLRHAWGMAFMRRIPRSVSTNPHAEDALLGKTPEIQRLNDQIRRVAHTDAAVLISGPPGSGKELAARSIHRQSERRDAPFVAVNCGAIGPRLLQTELFGYENPMAPPSARRKSGRIEAAHGGTLFLDDIDTMPFELQGSLLRFLQQKTVVSSEDREGAEGIEGVEVDLRLIAATQADLAQAVADGHFREDLYYRINVVCLDVPRLADRGQDIEGLARHYFNKFAGIHNRSLRGFSKAAMNALLSHSWPGNVRELVNRVQRAALLAEGRFIQPEDLGLERGQGQGKLMSLEDARAAAERIVIRRALAQSRNRISSAAALLGISRVTLYRLIEKYNIRSDMAPAPQSTFGNVLDGDFRK